MASDMGSDMNFFDSAFAFGDSSMSADAGAYSPAIPTLYDAPRMTRSDSNTSTHPGTISPQELMLFSAPPSTVFTNLTSPDLNDTLSFDDYEASPLFSQEEQFDVAGTGEEPWFPLFPDQSFAPQQSVEASETASSLDSQEEAAVSEQLRKKSRKSASPKDSPRASVLSGVNPRKRSTPLPAIVVEDPNDTIAIKRARNTLAARKSRQKKNEKVDELCEEIERLQKLADYWKQEALSRGATE